MIGGKKIRTAEGATFHHTRGGVGYHTPGRNNISAERAFYRQILYFFAK